MSQERLAVHLDCSPSLVSHIECGKRVPQRHQADAADRFFGTGEHFARLWRNIHEAAYGPHWYARWAEEIEPGARTLRSWDPFLIPGLLQTEAYARAVIAGGLAPPHEVENRVRARMARQHILDRDDPPELWVLIDETVVNRPIGDGEVMAAQLEHLLTAADRPNITVQVVPRETRTTVGLMSGFIIAESSDAPTAVSIESAGHGEVSADKDLVCRVWAIYDRLRAEAYRAVDSAKKIKEVRDQWTENPET
ncbi:helix-turn-helix transcriptional regulator [Thermocatellispora tengchongensis]